MSKLKTIREASGLSQNKLAEISGVSNRMIPKYETGEKDINKAQAETIYKLAKALNCNMEDLIEIDISIGDKVTIIDKESIYSGDWGVVKKIDGDDYYIAIFNGVDSIPIFNRYQLEK